MALRKASRRIGLRRRSTAPAYRQEPRSNSFCKNPQEVDEMPVRTELAS